MMRREIKQLLEKNVNMKVGEFCLRFLRRSILTMHESFSPSFLSSFYPKNNENRNVDSSEPGINEDLEARARKEEHRKAIAAETIRGVVNAKSGGNVRGI